MPFGFQFVLQIAGGEVNTKPHGVVVAMGEFRLYRASVFADAQHDLAFIVQVLGKIGVKERLVVHHDGRWRLHEHEWLCWYRVIEFFGVVNIVSANAKDFHKTITDLNRCKSLKKLLSAKLTEDTDWGHIFVKIFVMKNASYTTLFIVAGGLLSLLGLPWWTLVLVAAVAGFLFPASAAGAFAAGFLGGSLLWYGVAFWRDTANMGVFSTKIGEILSGLRGWQLLSVTGFLGGLLGGFGAMTGRLAAELLGKSAPARRDTYPRRRR